jgi:hypothetical protein
MDLDTSSSERTVYNREFIRSSVAINKVKGLTISRLTAWISQSWALISQRIPTAKRANPLKNLFFSVVACPKTSIAELSHLLDQSGHAWCHLQFSPLVVDERRKQMSIRPLRGNMNIN